MILAYCRIINKYLITIAHYIIIIRRKNNLRLLSKEDNN